MYTHQSPILYSEAARGELDPGQHTACFHILLVVSCETTVPLGFFCGGFSSTAGYVPGNEAHCFFKSRERRRSLLVVPCQKVSFVFIRTTRKSLAALSRASLSASIQGVNNS
jgi:hypothetical protein